MPAMPYRVREDLHFCRIGEQMVFLDLRKDRYFLLRGEIQRAFSAYVSGTTEVAIPRLLELGLLVESDGQTVRAKRSLTAPARSVFERAQEPGRPHLRTILEVSHLTFLTRRSLATRSIQDVTNEHLLLRRTACSKPHTRKVSASEGKLLDSVSDFMQARRLLPIDASCLLDSLVLHAFLLRRRLFSRVVFGVTIDPFSAHAWLQSGDLVLNDSVSHAGMHTPILVL